MCKLSAFISMLAVLIWSGCETKDPTSGKAPQDPAGKLTMSSNRAGGHGSGRMLSYLPRQGGLYAPYLGPVPSRAFERLGMVNTHSGKVTEVNDSFGPEFVYDESNPVLVASAAFDVDGTLFTLINRINLGEADPTTAQLATIDAYTGQITPIGNPNPFNLTGMEIDACGQIYATGFNAPPWLNGENRLYTIDKETGVATPKAGEMVRDNGDKLENNMDLAFDGAGTLYATAGNVLYTLDTVTGQIMSEVELSGGTAAANYQWY